MPRCFGRIMLALSAAIKSSQPKGSSEDCRNKNYRLKRGGTMYRITLLQNTQNRPAAAFEVVYTFAAGPSTWPVAPLGASQDTAVIVVNCAHNLVNQPGVQSRVLRAHYPVAPTVVDYPISSVQP